jgi:hypothetical protein
MKLDQVVRQHIAAKNDTTLHGYIRHLFFAIEGLKKQKMLGFDVKTVRLEPDSNLQAALPDDYLKWSKAAVRKGDRLIPLIPDGSLLSSQYEDRDNSGNEFEFLFINLDPDESIVPQSAEVLIVGEPQDASGYFRVDSENKVIQFDARFDYNEVFLEYITNTFSYTADTHINEMAVEIIRAYIWWMEAKYDRTFGDAHAETLMRGRQYHNRVDEFIANTSNITPELLADIQNRATHLGAVRSR